MKTILRKIAVYTFALFLLPSLIPGVEISGGLETLFVGGFVLALLFLVLKPILSIISFPINLLTLGLFSVIINAVILYALTRFVEDIKVSVFTYSEFQFFGFITPSISFNIYLSFLWTAFIISIIVSMLSWLMD